MIGLGIEEFCAFRNCIYSTNVDNDKGFKSLKVVWKVLVFYTEIGCKDPANHVLAEVLIAAELSI